MKNLSRVTIFSMAVLVLPSLAMATTRAAAGCSVAEIRTQIAASSAGDTVTVPAGTCTWETADCNGGSCLSITVPLNISGAGVGQTIITDNTIRDGSIKPIYVNYTDTTNSIFSISGFQFLDSVGTSDGFNGLVTIAITDSGAGKPTAYVHDITFDTTARRWLVATSVRGLVRNVTINSPGPAIIMAPNYTAAWTGATSLGSVDAWYIEDNTWTRTTAGDVMDCERGGKYVYRHNTFAGSSSFNNTIAFDHGYDSVERSCLLMEAYDNTNVSSSSSADGVFIVRGGTSMFFRNTWTGTWGKSHSIALMNYRSCATYSSTIGYCSGDASISCYNDGTCSGHGVCNKGTSNLCDGTSPMDGNTFGQAGYPCLDQIGRGGDQALYPAYQWQNQWGITPEGFGVFNHATSGCGANLTTYHVLENRDYYNYTAGFDGTVGVGVGVLSARPSTCTTGVGYWASDQGSWNRAGTSGVLYKCTATDTWTSYYTPFTYPHPLACGNTDSTPCVVPRLILRRPE
jgi:hypothetical protein